jgi:hypothetical protein
MNSDQEKKDVIRRVITQAYIATEPPNTVSYRKLALQKNLAKCKAK